MWSLSTDIFDIFQAFQLIGRIYLFKVCIYFKGTAKKEKGEDITPASKAKTEMASTPPGSTTVSLLSDDPYQISENGGEGGGGRGGPTTLRRAPPPLFI